MRIKHSRNLLIEVLIFVSLSIFSAIHVIGQIESTDGEPVNWESSARFNMAQSSRGAVAVGSSNYDAARFPASSAINGERAGYGWGSGSGGWNDGTLNSFPDTLEIQFDTVKKISEINVFTLQDNYAAPAEPTLDMTFSLYGIIAFEVWYLDANTRSWTLISTVANNNKVWRQFKFPAVETDKIKIVVNSSSRNYSRITEVEAWGGDAYKILLPEPSQQPVDCGTTPDLDTCEQMRNLLAAMKGGFDNLVQLPYGPDRTTSKGTPYHNWFSKLNWNYSNWQADGSKPTGSLNHPPIAHAISLWRSPTEFNRTRATSIQWWITFLDCQNGDSCVDLNPDDPASPYKIMRYLKSKELFSSTYDALTVTAIITVRHWAIRKIEAGGGTEQITRLLDKSGKYLQHNFRLYALAAGLMPAARFYHRSNLNDPTSAEEGCKRGQNYTGPFVALAGMRSPNFAKCQDDRSVLLANALDISLGNSDWQGKNSLNDIYQYLKTNFPSNSVRPNENHFAISQTLRDLINQQMTDPTTASTQSLINELRNVKTIVKYHFVGLAHSTGSGIKQNRVTLMEKNSNRNTAPTFGVKYYFFASRNEYEARILYPWSDQVLADRCNNGQDYPPWRKGITTGGIAQFSPHPIVGQPYSKPSSLFAENEPSCAHNEDGEKIVDSTTMPQGAVRYHIVFTPNSMPKCFTGCTSPN